MRSLCVHIYHKMSSLSLRFQGVMKHKRSGETKVLKKIIMSKMAGTGESKEETVDRMTPQCLWAGLKKSLTITH